MIQGMDGKCEKYLGPYALSKMILPQYNVSAKLALKELRQWAVTPHESHRKISSTHPLVSTVYSACVVCRTWVSATCQIGCIEGHGYGIGEEGGWSANDGSWRQQGVWSLTQYP